MAASPFLSEDDLHRFRTKSCRRRKLKACEFGENRCQYSHNEDWPRRCPFYLSNPEGLRYVPFLCPQVTVDNSGKMRFNSCIRGGKCPYAHSKEEEMYHPLVYKTLLCEDFQKDKCDKYYCPFVHGLAEKRTVSRQYKLPYTRGIRVPFHANVVVEELDRISATPSSPSPRIADSGAPTSNNLTPSTPLFEQAPYSPLKNAEYFDMNRSPDPCGNSLSDDEYFRERIEDEALNANPCFSVFTSALTKGDDILEAVLESREPSTVRDRLCEPMRGLCCNKAAASSSSKGDAEINVISNCEAICDHDLSNSPTPTSAWSTSNLFSSSSGETWGEETDDVIARALLLHNPMITVESVMDDIQMQIGAHDDFGATVNYTLQALPQQGSICQPMPYDTDSDVCCKAAEVKRRLRDLLDFMTTARPTGGNGRDTALAGPSVSYHQKAHQTWGDAHRLAYRVVSEILRCQMPATV